MIFTVINLCLVLLAAGLLLKLSSRPLLTTVALLLLLTAVAPILPPIYSGRLAPVFLPVISSLLLVGLLFFRPISSGKPTGEDHHSPLLPQQPSKDTSPDELIWESILRLTDPDALHSDWYSCFNRIHSDICNALAADDLFLLNYPSPGGASPMFQDKCGNDLLTYRWITSIEKWISPFYGGEYVHCRTEDFDMEERLILEHEGIKVLLLIPLIINGELLGLVGISRKETGELFDRRQTNGLRFIANILSMAISNQHNRSERDRLVTVVEQSSDCIIITTTDGSVLYANPACQRVTGFSPGEIVGRSFKHLYRPPVRKKMWPQMKENLAKSKGWSDHFANYRKDGSLYQEAMLVSPVYDKEGGLVNHVIVKRDVTEENRLESIAEAANLMDNIGFIFSSIRHELGNPINAIKVSLSVLESNLESYDTEDVKRFISRSLSDISRVEYLLKTLKNFSIFERPDIQKTDMANLLDKLTKLTETDLAKQYVMLAIDHPPIPLIGMVDPRAFLQVLLNLIANAVAALEGCDNKQISLSLAQKQKHQIVLTLKDNGCGMDGDTIKNLFRPFFTTKAEGTGLGLVIVKKMLAKMNCSITASSQKGKGTRMEIIIPAA